MSDYLKVYIGCFHCDGTGIEEEHYEDGELIPERSCPYCGGDGMKTITQIIDITDLMAKIDDILDKCNDIKEKVDEL